jgi:hypothetical protein
MNRQSIRASNRARAKESQKEIMRAYGISKAFIAYAKRYGSDAESMIGEFKKAMYSSKRTAAFAPNEIADVAH